MITKIPCSPKFIFLGDGERHCTMHIQNTSHGNCGFFPSFYKADARQTLMSYKAFCRYFFGVHVCIDFAAQVKEFSLRKKRRKTRLFWSIVVNSLQVMKDGPEKLMGMRVCSGSFLTMEEKNFGKLMDILGDMSHILMLTETNFLFGITIFVLLQHAKGWFRNNVPLLWL